MSVPNRVKINVYNAPIAGVRDGVRFVTGAFEPEIPEECEEAHRAITENASWKRRRGTEIAGASNQKFSRDDDFQSKVQNEWRVQAILSTRDPRKIDTVHAYWEGWTPEYVEPKDASESTGWPRWRPTIKMWRMHRILNKRDQKTGEPVVARALNMKAALSGSVWRYLDMEYYHSLKNRENGGGDIFYMCRDVELVPPPCYKFITTNLIQYQLYNQLRESRASKPFSALSRRASFVAPTVQSVCENPLGCRCDARFKLLYGSLRPRPVSLKYDSDGLLRFAGSVKACSVAMECSDVCGCTINCPRRQLQRGSRKSIIVDYENPHSKFGLKATRSYKKGELVGEYHGELLEMSPTSNSSYEVYWKVLSTSLVIDARIFGNAMRFGNHHCAGNTKFVEVFSREKETDVLVPRIGLYATETIKTGEAITLNYWPELTNKKVKKTKSSKKCRCGFEKCIGYLPVR